MINSNSNRNTVLATVLTGIVCLTALFSGCTGQGGPDRTSDSTETVRLDSIQAEHDITDDAYRWADSIIASMTVEQMAGQLIMPTVFADASPDAIRLLRRYSTDCHIGGVVLLKGTVSAARTIADTLRSILSPPPFIAIDAEWGLAMRLDDTPEFPRNGRIRPEADEDAMYDYGYEMARECREIGVNMVLGPVLDVLPGDKRRSVIGMRSFGHDPERAAMLGVAYAKGLEAGNVLSVAKHFPGHGGADADSHRRLPVVARSREELEASDLVPFREYIANGLRGVMAGHLSVPALDPEGTPVSVSEKILQGFLREELGFDGLIVTDAINMAGAAGHSAADAIIAGADMVLGPVNTEKEVMQVVEAAVSGRLSGDVLRDRVRRVLFFKYMLARDSKGSGNIGETEEAERIIKLLR